jgi:aspartate/methionine/tyrosine aminotransferase
MIPYETYIQLGQLMKMRATALYETLESSGLFCDIIPPNGALYVMAKFNPQGPITNTRELFIRTGIAAVDAQAFGAEEGWVRFSVSNVDTESIQGLRELSVS